MRALLLILVLMIAACTSDPADSPENVLEPDMDVLQPDEGGTDVADSTYPLSNLPQPRFERADYVRIAERLCVVGGDRSKKVFSLQALAYHFSGDALTFRNGAGLYLFVNEACEAWIMIGKMEGLGDSFLQMPAYKHLTTEQFAILLENYRVLEFRDFGKVGFTRHEQPNMLLFEVDGLQLALGYDYFEDYVDRNGIPREEMKDQVFEDHELLAIAILRYAFWEDSEFLAGATPYRGERLWFTASPERGPNFFPERLVQDWPFEVGPEEMGVITKGCSDFGSLTGDEADKFRTLRDTMLAMEPKDSYGHWAVPMKWGESTYLVEMAEGFPLEDEDGYIPWMGIRMLYLDCSEE